MNLTRPITSFLTFLGAFLTIVALSGGAAEARPNTQDYTCAGVRAFVDQQGTVVMNTKNRNVYRKFYARNYQCPFSNVHTRHSVPTKSGMCTLFICREPRRPFFKRFN